MLPKELPSVDFAARRKTFLARAKGGVAIFPAASESLRNSDVEHPFRQDSSFFYLTGFEEPHSQILLAPHSETPFQIFVQPQDAERAIWEGKVTGPEAAKQRLRADAAHPSIPDESFDEAFIEAMQEAEFLYYRLGRNEAFDRRILRLLSDARRGRGRKGLPLWPIHDPDEILGEMRLHKSKAEIDRLQVAAHLTAEAHISAMKITKPGMFEYEIEAILYHAVRVQGAGRLGYPSIVASGANACALHYHHHDRRMNAGELVLVDAGGEFDYYTADISRTYPVGGRFSQEQREIYIAVLEAQKQAIAMVRPGRTLQDIHRTAVETLIEELRRLKVLKGTPASLFQKKTYLPFYPHGTSHWLGMDVHDSGPYYRPDGKPIKLEPGMVFTVEPGLYFSPDSNQSPARYRGIGIRIEDDILVTSGGCKVLTSGVPKEIEEVESLCSSN